jgi:hypothetical protein
MNSPELFNGISIGARAYVESHHGNETVVKLFNNAIHQAGSSAGVSGERERE